MKLWSARCIPLNHDRYSLGSIQELETLFKVDFLGTAVVVAAVESVGSAERDIPQLVQACQRAIISSPDADAICVAEPANDWPCLLFSQASMRYAFELPAGVQVGPIPVFVGLGIVDTLWKYLEGAAPVWEVTESTPRDLGSVDISAIAERNAQASIAAVEAEGRRALQPAKNSSWTTLPAGLDGRVSRFVAAVTQSVPVEDALAELNRENHRD